MTTDIGQAGQIIDGKYRIVRLLGTGGMGAVYEGENVRIRRKVAIKMLHASVSSQAEVVERFEREAKAAAMVGSEHICEVLDMGELADRSLYMVMEYLDGETLSGLIKRSGRLTPQQSTPILLQVLEALGAAHTAGIIHRDLKPDNIFILPQRGGIQNFVKILDFGVSKFSQLSGESMNVTRAGAVVGTPYYMSPEQARGGVVDQRTDIYSIGVLLYQATTGQVPYNAETFNELLFKIVLEAAPPLQTYVPDLDPEFAAIVQRAMAREPDQRFPSCAHFRDALLQYQATRLQGPPRAPTLNPHDPFVSRTEVLDLSQLPGAAGAPGGRSSASWPGAPPADGTIPMQPGLPIAAQMGPGNLPTASQSGAAWPGVPAPVAGGAPQQAVQGPMATSTTANSWGNLSSGGSAAKPKSRAGVVIGVVALAALLGVGGAVVAFMAMGKPTGHRAAASTTSTATSTATAPATSAPPAATAAAPTATASASTAPDDSAAPADTTPKPALFGKLPTGAGGVSPGVGSSGKPGGSKPGLQPGNNGKPPGGKPPGGKPPGGDLGY
jgi:serine/threonine protein kinase